MFFTLSKFLDLLFSPLTWGLALAGVGVLRQKRPRLVIAGIAVLLFFAADPVASGLYGYLERSAPSTYDPAVVYDAVVLLGGITDERVTAATGGPSYNDNVERLVVTHRLARDGHAKVVVVSGGAVDPALAPFAEGRVLAAQLRDWGIAEDRVVVEDRARNTRENALFVRELARARGMDRVLVVTSAFHMRRAADAFAAAGMSVDTLPVDFRAVRGTTLSAFVSGILPRSSALAMSTAALRELAGRLVYRAVGYGK